MKRYDTLVIGAGHNGLVCASYLAKAGQSVLVLEANETVGGLAATREFHPGFATPIAHTLVGLADTVVKELDLEKYGFKAAEHSLPLTAIHPSEAAIQIDGSTVSGVGTEDEAAYRALQEQLKRFAAALGPFWERTMPRIGSTSAADLFTFGKLGLKLRMLGRDDMLEFMRVATLPMRDLADECFDNERLKAAVCWDGLVGSKLAPRSPNQAVLTLLNRMAGKHGGQHSIPANGIKGLMDALLAAAKANGAEVRTGCPVERVTVDGDENGQRISGVRLVDGEEISAARVVSSADPKTTFLGLVGTPHLEIDFSNRIRRLRTDGYVAKLHLALSGKPAFQGVDDPSGRLLIAPSMDSIEFAYDNAKYGEAPEEAVMEVVLPSLAQAELAPSGSHVLSAHVMYVPGNLKGGWNEEAKASLTQQLIRQLEAYAPGISALVVASELLTPVDLERDYHVSGGHWHHAEPAIDQLLMMRPTYEAAQYGTPIEGLYLCGAGSHPGGDINGNPGRNAAREMLS